MSKLFNYLKLQFLLNKIGVAELQLAVNINILTQEEYEAIVNQ